MNITRRDLLPLTLASVGAVALAGCANFKHAFPNGNASLAQASTYVANINAAFQKVVPSLFTVVSIPATVQAKVRTALADLQVAAGNLAAAASETAAQPIVQEVEADVNSLVNTTAAFAALLPPPVAEAFQAAAILLPVIEAAVGMVAPAAISHTSADRIAQANKALVALAR